MYVLLIFINFLLTYFFIIFYYLLLNVFYFLFLFYHYFFLILFSYCYFYLVIEFNCIYFMLLLLSIFSYIFSLSLWLYFCSNCFIILLLLVFCLRNALVCLAYASCFQIGSFFNLSISVICPFCFALSLKVEAHVLWAWWRETNFFRKASRISIFLWYFEKFFSMLLYHTSFYCINMPFVFAWIRGLWLWFP